MGPLAWPLSEVIVLGDVCLNLCHDVMASYYQPAEGDRRQCNGFREVPWGDRAQADEEIVEEASAKPDWEEGEYLWPGPGGRQQQTKDAGAAPKVKADAIQQIEETLKRDGPQRAVGWQRHLLVP
jgi:hypothetical protein